MSEPIMSYEDWLLGELLADADRASEEEEPITVTPAVKQAVIDAIFEHENNLYRVAQRTAPDDVDVCEFEFDEFMCDVRWALARLLKE